MILPLTEAAAHAVYDILAQHCGAPDGASGLRRKAFVEHHTQSQTGQIYTFDCTLGKGSQAWSLERHMCIFSPVKKGMNRHKRTPMKHIKMCEIVNQKLREFFQEQTQKQAA